MKERRPSRPSPFRHAEGSTPDDRRRDLLDRLEHQVGLIQDSDAFRRYLDVQARFHAYSWGNVCLMLAQRPDATRVAGYVAWQQLGRQVLKGERAINIVVPMPRKVEDQETGADQTRLRFGIGNVFDFAQTDGDPLPDFKVPILEGDEGGHLYDALAEVARADGVIVERRGEYSPGMADRMGHYEPGARRIVVRGSVPQLQQTKTVCHELAHHLTGKHETYGEFRDEHETIAEATAYVVLAHFGLDSGARSFPSIATWARDRAVLRGVLGTTQGVASTIVSKIEAQHGIPVEAPSEEVLPR
jgi:hypothetical protein